jgi:hypothetical protein
MYIFVHYCICWYMLTATQKQRVAKPDAETVREYVYDRGLVGASNRDLSEQLYDSLVLGEEDIGRREKIKVLSGIIPQINN